MTARKHVNYLSSSENRVTVLAALVEAPQRPRDLAAAHPMSRTTVQRTLSGLVDRGWVRKESGRYEATPAGELVLRQYRELTAAVELTEDLRTFLASFGDAPIALRPAAFAGAEVVTATPENPHAAVNHYVEHVAETGFERFRGVTPVISPFYERTHRRTLAPDVEAEFVVDRDVVETARENYPDNLADAREADALTVYVSPQPLAHSVAILDDRVFLGAFEDGHLRASLSADDDALRRWATRLFEQYRDRSRPLSATSA